MGIRYGQSLRRLFHRIRSASRESVVVVVVVVVGGPAEPSVFLAVPPTPTRLSGERHIPHSSYTSSVFVFLAHPHPRSSAWPSTP